MTEPWPPTDEGWDLQRPRGPYAGFGVRLAAWFMDAILLGLVHAILDALTNGFGDVDREIGDFGWRTYAIATALALAYTCYFIGSTSGQTVGMRAMNIRVVDGVTGGRVDYGRCVIRYVVGVASGFVFFIGYLWMLWDPQRQTWHDKAAGTIVVPVEDYPVERWPG